MKVILITNVVVASQLRSLITKCTPDKNAIDSVPRVTPNKYFATLRAKLAKAKSPIRVEMSMMVTLIAPYIDIVMQKMNNLNHMRCSIRAMPSPGSKLLAPPGNVKPAANVTVTIRVETNIRVLILSLH